MLMLILTWTGAVLGLSLLLIMALGPAIVEIDSWWYERKHERRRRARANAAESGSRKSSGPHIALRTQPTHIS